MINGAKNIESLTKPLSSFILENPDKLNLPAKVINLELKPLGKGESNLSILAVVNDQYRLVFRIAQLYKNMLNDEFAILSKIPSGVGPNPIYLNSDKDVIPFSFLVESFIPGKSVFSWDKESLASLAKSLARLHNETKTTRVKQVSFISSLERDNNFFFKKHPQLNNDKETSAILKAVIKYLTLKEPLLNEVTQVSIVHGDLNTDNIKLGDDKSIRFIDWELAHYNDPAREFSTFYYDDMKYLNWRIHLKSPLKEYFLSKYKSESDTDNGLDDRVLAWQIVDKAGALIFCSWKSLTAQDAKTKDKFTSTANLLKQSLKKMPS